MHEWSLLNDHSESYTESAVWIVVCNWQLLRELFELKRKIIKLRYNRWLLQLKQQCVDNLLRTLTNCSTISKKTSQCLKWISFSFFLFKLSILYFNQVNDTNRYFLQFQYVYRCYRYERLHLLHTMDCVRSFPQLKLHHSSHAMQSLYRFVQSLYQHNRFERLDHPVKIEMPINRTEILFNKRYQYRIAKIALSFSFNLFSIGKSIGINNL